jgi:uncharacterized protein (TIGR00369 family)
MPHEMHYNPLGTVHGGVIATVLDSATGCAVPSVLSAGKGYTSLDLTVKYLCPVTVETGPITATGTVLSPGSRTALAKASLTDSRDRLHWLCHFDVHDLRPAGLSAVEGPAGE